MEEKVDILLATYKTHLPFLKEQIESILSQSYKNIQLIISDDCSQDKKLEEVLKEYEKKDNRVKLYLQEKNLGYNKNFEFLLSKSEANYIMFSDHDDIWYKNKVEKSVKKIKEENVDLVYCNAKQIDENGKILQENYFKYKNMPLIKGKNNTLALTRCIGIGCSQIITKYVKDKMIPFKSQVIAHDWLASFIASENKGIDYIEEPLFSYRLHTTNVFGGRNLSQNIGRWKKENGKSYESYLKYREQKVINKAYLDGIKMCIQYSQTEKNKKVSEELIKYYENIKKSKIINLKIGKYKYLYGKNLLKKMVKEMLIFHFPILGYIIYIAL